jgi:orotidine-5'-phosphate decarboxylase
VRYARAKGLIVLADVKRADISSTADACAAAFLGPVASAAWADPEQWVDALTINPYLGRDGVTPFLDRGQTSRGSGAFILVKTSNPSAGEL